MGSGKFINQEIYMSYLGHVDYSGMAVHLTKSDDEGF
jgi:hypothetical protein